MNVLKTAAKGGVAALVVAVMTVGAYAWPAAATTTLNVRAGPGTHFHVVDVLARHEQVNVDYCRGNWCFVHTRSHQGWASAGYLARITYDRPHYPQPPRWQRPPHWGNGWNRGWSNHRPNPHYPSRSGAQVCVNGANASFCISN